MDNKRLLIATVLCFAILLGWQSLSEYMGWIPEPVPVETAQPGSAQPEAVTDTAGILAESPAETLPLFAPTAGREVRVETPLYTAVFHSGGAILQSFVLKNYSAQVGPDSPPMDLVSPAAAAVSPMGLLLNGQPSWNIGAWSFTGGDLHLAEGESGTLVFEGEAGGIHLTRTLTFHADTYLIDESIALRSPTPTSVRLGCTLATSKLSGGSNYDPMTLVWNRDDKLERERNEKDLTNEGVQESGNLWWAGMMSNYFLAAMAPADDVQAVFKGRITTSGVWRAALETDIPVNSGADALIRMNWWMGPKDRDLLKKAPRDLASSVDMGIFGFLSVPLLRLLSFLQSLVGNWGLAIIALTVLIKIVFWPLTRKSFKSMEQMKKIQPMMKQLQEKYGKDREALSREMMQLYRTYGVNPMGGCLPILIQLPVFVALYQALLNSIELRHASFITYLPFTDTLWLADLSAKDPFYITPLVMGATMFLQQWLSPAMGDPTQRKMMMFMPLIFTVMFINFPSGLVVYWLCNNILSIAQQWWTLRKA